MEGVAAMNQVKNSAKTVHKWTRICNGLSLFFSKYRLSHGWWDYPRAGAVALIVTALCLTVPFAVKGGVLGDLIAALNALIAQEGPVPGSVAEEIPQPQANDEMAAEGNRLSSNQINTQLPEHANQFAFETSAANQTAEVAGTNINQANLQGNGKIDVPTGATASPLFNAAPFSQQMLRFEEFGPVPLGSSASVIAGNPLPAPPDAESLPDELALDAFLDSVYYSHASIAFSLPDKEGKRPG